MAWAVDLGGGIYSMIAAEKQAKELKAQGQVAFGEAKREGKAFLSKQIAIEGASGFEVGSTSFESIGLADAQQLERMALAKRYEYRAAAKRARQSGILALLGGAGSAVSDLYGQRQGKAAGGGGMAGGGGGTRLSGTTGDFGGSGGTVYGSAYSGIA